VCCGTAAPLCNARSVRYYDGNGWIWPGAIAVAAVIAAAVWLFWLLVFGFALVALWALVAALFGR
jgi:hypothetical protein